MHGGLYQKYGYTSIHAEVACLKGINKADKILVVRQRREDKKLTMSKPCSRCQKFLKDKGIKKVVFSDWEGNLQEMRL